MAPPNQVAFGPLLPCKVFAFKTPNSEAVVFKNRTCPRQLAPSHLRNTSSNFFFFSFFCHHRGATPGPAQALHPRQPRPPHLCLLLSSLTFLLVPVGSAPHCVECFPVNSADLLPTLPSVLHLQHFFSRDSCFYIYIYFFFCGNLSSSPSTLFAIRVTR